MKEALIIGSGFLGSHIIDELKKQNIRATGTSFSNLKTDTLKLDIRNLADIDKCIMRINPDLIINCAANTQVDFLEKNPEIAFSINTHGAANIARVSKKYDIKFVHISTDSVFDGNRGFYTEEDKLNPVNVYAKSKALGEKLVKQYSDNYIIIRTNFFGYNKENKFFFNWILNMLKNNNQLTGFYDVIVTPLEVSLLSQLILDIIKQDYNGIIHLSSNEATSKYNFALLVAKIFNLDSNLIKKTSIDSVKFEAKRPKDTSLSNKKAKQIMTLTIPSLVEQLNKIKKVVEYD